MSQGTPPNTPDIPRHIPQEEKAEGSQGEDKDTAPTIPTEHARKPRRLSDREKTFAEHYAQTGNATQSAKAAGYSAKSASKQGCKMLKKREISELVQILRGEGAVQAGESVAGVLRDLRALHDLAKAADDLATAAKCLQLLGSHMGMFKDKTDPAARDLVPIPPSITMEDYLAIVAQTTAAAVRKGLKEGEEEGIEGTLQ